MSRLASVALSAALVCISSLAHAEPVHLGESAGWNVAFEPDGAACIAAPKDLEGLFFFEYPDGMQLVFGSKRLSWVEDQKQYPVVVRTDGRGWRGEMVGFVGGNGSFGLRLLGPADEFVRALGAAGRFRLDVEGVSYGPYSLTGSSKALALLRDCKVRRDEGAFEPQKPVQLPYRQLHEWGSEEIGKTFTGEGWTAKLQHQENIDGTSTVYLEVAYEGKGREVLKLEGAGAERSSSGYLGVFPLKWGDPSLVFGSYTGGAHCCMSAVAAVAQDGGVRQVEIGNFDGDGLRVTDIDGDSVFEVSTVDQRFLYAFGAYALSLPPPKILSLQGLEFQNVTKEVSYQGYLKSKFITDLAAVDLGEDVTDGQVAGLLAAAANVGAYHQTLNSFDKERLDRLPDELGRQCGPPDCETARQFKTLRESVETRLSTWGYDIKQHLNQPTLAFFAELVRTKGFGPPEANYENSCSNIPTRFELEGDRFVRMNGYEMSCEFSQINAFDDAALGVGFCSGEGEYWWENYYFKRDDEAIKIASWRDDLSEILAANSAPPTSLPECR